MNKKILTVVLAIFLIGNFHVVTDWCYDLPVDSVIQNIDQNKGDGLNAEKDLCGHCGHLGLNIMQITPSGIDIVALDAKSNPIEPKITFNSNHISPPTRPPLHLS